MSGHASRLARAALPPLLAIIALALAAPAAWAAPKGFFGVTSIQSPDAEDLRQMGRAGVATLHMPFGWEELEPEPGTYALADLDRVVADAAAEGIRVRPFVFGTPPWARDCRGIPAAYCDRVNPLRTAAGRQRWPILLRTLVERYGAAGSLWTDATDAHSPPYMPIREWQIWSEPNSSTFFRPKPSPRAYFKLLSSASQAIRGADGQARILLAGLFGAPPRGMRAWTFLDKLYRMKGARRQFQGVAIHPYSPDIDGVTYQIERMRRVMAEHRSKRQQLYLTELGWGSGKGSSPLHKGLKGQAGMLRAAFRFALRNRKRYRIAAVDWFSWRDVAAGTGAACILCESFGLTRFDHSKKPSLAAFARFTGGKA